MPIYNEVVQSSGVDRKVRYILRAFEQPRYRRMIEKVYFKWSMLSFPIMKRIEKPLRQLHNRRCRDGCTYGYESRTGKRVRVCGYIPLTNRQDLRHYELSVKGRTDYVQHETTPEVARQHGWKI